MTTPIGFVIQPEESIPEDVNRVADKDEHVWQRQPTDRWFCVSYNLGTTSIEANVLSREWGPLAVTAVREQPAEPNELARRNHERFIAEGCCGMVAVHLADCPKFDRAKLEATLRKYVEHPAEPGPVDVLDLVRQYAVMHSACVGLTAGGAEEPARQHHEQELALFARIEAEVNRLRTDTAKGVLIKAIAERADEFRTQRDEARAEVERLNAEAERVTNDLVEARDERDDYAARLKATDASWAKVAAERDEARTGLRRLRADREAHEEALDWSNGHLMQALGVEQLTEVIPAIERLKAGHPDPSSPLVLRLPEVPEGAVALQGGARWVRSPYLPDSWVLDGGSVPHMLGALLDAEDGSVTVVMAPPREPRTWPALPGDPEGVTAVRGASGRIYRPHRGFWVWRDLDGSEVSCDSFASLQNYDGPLVEVLDDKDGTR